MILEAILHLCGVIAEFWINLTGFRKVNQIMVENLDKQHFSSGQVNQSETTLPIQAATPESLP